MIKSFPVPSCCQPYNVFFGGNRETFSCENCWCTETASWFVWNGSFWNGSSVPDIMRKELQAVQSIKKMFHCKTFMVSINGKPHFQVSTAVIMVKNICDRWYKQEELTISNPVILARGASPGMGLSLQDPTVLLSEDILGLMVGFVAYFCVVSCPIHASKAVLEANITVTDDWSNQWPSMESNHMTLSTC